MSVWPYLLFTGGKLLSRTFFQNSILS